MIDEEDIYMYQFDIDDELLGLLDELETEDEIEEELRGICKSLGLIGSDL